MLGSWYSWRFTGLLACLGWAVELSNVLDCAEEYYPQTCCGWNWGCEEVMVYLPWAAYKMLPSLQLTTGILYTGYLYVCTSQHIYCILVNQSTYTSEVHIFIMHLRWQLMCLSSCLAWIPYTHRLTLVSIASLLPLPINWWISWM